MKKEIVNRSKNKIVSWDSHLDKKYGKHGCFVAEDKN